MTSRVLFVGDIHIKPNTLQVTREFTDKLVLMAKQERPDIIVLLGDLLHTHNVVHTPCLNHAYDLVDRLRSITNVWICVGNHDYISNSEFLTDKHWMNAMKEWEGVIICDRPKYLKHGSNHFIGMPYVEPGMFIKGLEQCEEFDWKESGCIFAHQEFYGCKFESGTSTEGDAWAASLPLIVSGHIHKKHWLADNIYYVGSAMQHTFAEDKNKSVSLITFLDNKMNDIKDIHIDTPIYNTVKCGIEGIDSISYPDRNERLRVFLDCESGEFSSIKRTPRFKHLQKMGVKIEFRPTNRMTVTKMETIKECDENLLFNDVLYNLICENHNTKIKNNMLKEYKTFF